MIASFRKVYDILFYLIFRQIAIRFSKKVEKYVRYLLLKDQPKKKYDDEGQRSEPQQNSQEQGKDADTKASCRLVLCSIAIFHDNLILSCALGCGNIALF